jgi:hypothetical protein
LETVIALFLSVAVLMALGGVMLLNQRAYGWGRDKIILQQNVTESLDQIGRLVRMSRRLVVTSATQFSTYDENGLLAHTVRRALVGGVGRLQKDGVNLVDRTCVTFDVQPNADTTAITIAVEMQDVSGNRVRSHTTTALRSRDFEF